MHSYSNQAEMLVAGEGGGGGASVIRVDVF